MAWSLVAHKHYFKPSVNDYRAKSFNLGFVGDAHGHVHLLDRVRSTHSEVEQWFYLGDLVSFQSPDCNLNKTAQEWFFENKDKFIFIKGNHDHVTAKGLINIDHSFAWELAQFHRYIKIILPNNRDLFLCHSKPKDFWSFIDIGLYSEREFIDDFCEVIDEHATKAVVIGHNHKQFTMNFEQSMTSIWSVGSIRDDGRYAILNENGIQYKKI